jgi:hypothetical protein
MPHQSCAGNPDNTLIATVNMRRTYLPESPPIPWRGKPYSSLSLAKFAPLLDN